MIKCLPILMLLFAGLGCAMLETVESTRIPQAEIRQTYRVSADRNETHAAAIFYHGSWGKTVDLDAASRIVHNDREMPQISPNFLKGTTYDVYFKEFQTRHVFVYTNGEGRVFRNEMSFEPIEINLPEAIVSRARNIVVPLSRAVRENEQISISLASTEARPAAEPANDNSAGPPPPNSPVYDLTLNGELDAARAAVVLKPKNLKNFVAGKAVLKIEVSRSLNLQQAAPAGGSMSWAYTSAVPASVVD